MELRWFILTLLLTVYKSNGEIRQEPEIFANRSLNVTLTCQHDNSDHYRLFWYKQAKGTVGLSLLVFSAGQNQVSIEEPFKTQESKYAATRPEIKMSTLQINRLETEDSALYYCATSTQYYITAALLNNNHKVNTAPCFHLSFMMSFPLFLLIIDTLNRAVKINLEGVRDSKEWILLFNVMGLLSLGFILLLVIKSLGGITIFQNGQVSKTQLIIQRDKQVTLKCNHDDGTYYYMYWYRQRGQGELALVAISIAKDNVETVAPFTKTKYIMERPEIKESSLEIKNLAEEDSGVYFCASSITQYLNLAKHLNNNLNLSHDDQRENT